MAQLDDLILHLVSEYKRQCGKDPIPSATDGEARKLIELISAAEEPTRKEIIARLSEPHGYVLAGFGEAMASYAVRMGQVHFIQEGLTALSISWFLIYWKDVLPVLSLLYQSAQKIGADPREVLKAANYLNPDFQSVVFADLESKKMDWSIEVMGFVEGKDEDGFRYRRRS